MKTELINLIKINMEPYLNEIQLEKLNEYLEIILNDFEVFKKDKFLSTDESKENQELLMSFLSAKQIEGCSEKPLIITETRFSRCWNQLILKSKASQLMI